MNKPHKHKDVIIAWANGAEVERYCKVNGIWDIVDSPSFDEYSQFRVKKEPKIVVTRCYIKPKEFSIGYNTVIEHGSFPNLQLEFTDGKLTDATIIND